MEYMRRGGRGTEGRDTSTPSLHVLPLHSFGWTRTVLIPYWTDLAEISFLASFPPYAFRIGYIWYPYFPPVSFPLSSNLKGLYARKYHWLFSTLNITT